MSIFKDVIPFINGNKELLQPQIEAYEAAHSYYQQFTDPTDKETLIIMPTGSGKTGLMALLPFQISNGRVLIIAPGRIVRKTIFKEFDSMLNPEKTFWYKRKIIFDSRKFPRSYLYKGYNSANDGEKEAILQKLHSAHIIITNVHKLTASSEDVQLINLLPPDFFDMIIIDEAHHSAANMWQETLNHFNASKVIMLTATPFRSDGVEISTNPKNPIYEYTLGEAILDGFVKDVVKNEEIPGDLEFIHEETGEKYSLKQARKMLGDDWVNRSIAMSEECSKAVIERAFQVLKEKRLSYPHHQILAVACNDNHAQELTKWFEEKKLKATYVSSRLSDKENEKRINDYCNGLYDAMINIQMLGEGFDNPNTSIIAIFRPFKTFSPYAQVIGRGLRKIRDESTSQIDNFCHVVHHQELNLQKLWNYYKYQRKYAEIKRSQFKQLSEQLSWEFDEVGFVEKEPNLSGSKKTSTTEEEPIPFNISVGRVNIYKSHGVGNEDSFTHDGYDRYRQAVAAVLAKKEQEDNASLSNLKDLLEKGAISQKQFEILKQSQEQERQDEWNSTYQQFHDFATAEGMREEFKIWMNNEFEKFFRASVLHREELDLHRDFAPSDAPINNIGFISKTIYVTLYQTTRKNIPLYNPTDFKVAKLAVMNKLNFYLEQYGRKEDFDEFD